MRPTPRNALLILFQLAVLNPLAANPGHAFAPQATGEIAARTPSALPPAAHWDTGWNEALRAETERILEAEEECPERHAYLHRYVAGSGKAHFGSGVAASGAAVVLGVAPRQLATAASGLEQAFRAGLAAEIVTQMARVAICSSDLADPFQTTPIETPEVPGARAQFCDLITAEDVPAEPSGGRDSRAHGRDSDFSVASTVDAGVALAIESARRRATVEEVVTRGDRVHEAYLRGDRLSAALSLARAIAVNAWERAGSPSLGSAAEAPGTIRVWPNPSVASANLEFMLPAPGSVRIDLFDVSGRRVWTRDVGVRAPGPNLVEIGAGSLDPLPAGIYIPRITAAGYRAQGRFVHLVD